MDTDKKQKTLLIITSIMLIMIVIFDYTGLAKWTEVKLGSFQIVPIMIGVFTASLYHFLEKRFGN